MPPTRTLLLPVVPDALYGLYQLEDPLFMTLRPNGLRAPNDQGVPIPGAPIEDVCEAYWRVLDALPDGTPELVEELEDDLPGVPMLLGPDGGGVVHLAAIEVDEADLAMLAAFADALDRAAGPRPGPEFAALTEALVELGREPHYPWLPEEGAATVARWVRRALSPVLHSPFEGPHGAADRETLSAVLRRAEDWGNVDVDPDEVEAIGRVMMSMLRAALDDQDEAALTT